MELSTHTNPDAPIMSLDEARRVIWQTQPKEPMGQLLDQGRLTRKDLEWAITKAYRADVRSAAQRLLLELDSAPTASSANALSPASLAAAPAAAQAPTADTSPRSGPKVVTASTYLGRQEELHEMLLAFYIGVGIIIFITTLMALLWLQRGQQPVLATLVLIVNVVIFGFVLAQSGLRRRNKRSYRAGRKGEEQVLDQLRTALDDRWTIYHNLQLPDHKDDLDLILVGPGGVWVVQVKAFKNAVRYHNGSWEYQTGRNWRVVNRAHDPAQSKRQAALLSDYLAKQSIQRWVEPAIALAESVPENNIAGSPIPVWLPFTISERIRSLATRTSPSKAELEQINALLRSRAVEQRAVEHGRRKRG